MNTIIVGDFMYKKIVLKYPSLEPYIDDKTLDLHFNKHYQKYLDNLNELLNDNNYDYQYDLKELVNKIDLFDEKVRGNILYNAFGVLNHELYFSILNVDGKKEPSGALRQAIIDKYGSYNNFVSEFMKSANQLKGAGFTYLVLNNGELDIINMSNQETPYMYGMIPLIALDMWEHSYYLKYQNNKEQYIKNFFSIIDFNIIEDIYEKESNTFK